MNEYKWAVPVKVAGDPLELRLDFHNESVVLTEFYEDGNQVRMVSARDVAYALAKELSYGSGLLPEGTLWFSNTKDGPVYALYEAPRTRKVALAKTTGKPLRYTIPLPGLIFLCSPGKPPHVYAVKRKPSKMTDLVYHAPLLNVFENGASCPGNHVYPARVQDVVESFFQSFFSGFEQGKRSVKYKSVAEVWKALDGKKKYPMGDLVKFGTLEDLAK